jgi:hypothetical protein
LIEETPAVFFSLLNLVDIKADWGVAGATSSQQDLCNAVIAAEVPLKTKIVSLAKLLLSR